MGLGSFKAFEGLIGAQTPIIFFEADTAAENPSVAAKNQSQQLKDNYSSNYSWAHRSPTQPGITTTTKRALGPWAI
jgi:hypothetical protein